MDFVSALSAVSGSTPSVSGSAPSGAVAGSQLLHQGNGMTFSFELPKPVEGAAPAQGASEVAGSAAATGALSSADGGGSIVRMISQVNDYQATAGAKIRDVLMGGKTTVDEAMVATQESGVAFKLLAEVRNKAVDSYQSIMQMQI